MKEHVFVVRIWREYREIEGEAPRFRGMIQHAVTGEKQYFNDINNIAEFLATHLNLADAPDIQSKYHAQLWSEDLPQSSNLSPKEPGVQDGPL
ncbi:MAG: hypothetical protein H6658_03240 [Ardenticatenaceae bacterium]|nr:hypothetical protein [Ardenticatenaceae bacterium]